MKHFNGCGRAGLLAVTSEKNMAPSVPLEAYGRVFVIEPTYPEVCVACVREEKKKREEKSPWPSFQWQATSLMPAKKMICFCVQGPSWKRLNLCPED